MQSTRTSSLFSVACLLVVLACTALVMRRPMESAPLHVILGAPGAALDENRFRLVYVFRPEDCAGNLRLLTVIQRPALRSLLTADGMVYGSGKDLPGAHRLLARAGVDTPIRPLTTRQSAALEMLGHRAMPFWLLFDPEGRLVLSFPTPSTPEDHLRMIELLTRITGAQRD